MQPLSKDREEKEGGVSKIEWDSIVSVQASERNPKEFTIFILPPHKKKGPGNKQGNTQQVVFSCKERNRLMTEMIHKLHIINDNGLPHLVEKAWHQNDIYKPNSKRIVLLKIHPSVIQVIVTKQGIKRVKSQHQMQQQTTETKDDIKKQLDEDQEQDDNLLDYATEDMQDYELEDEDGDLLLQEYESEHNNDNMITQRNIMTPYKGSMLGGTILGEMEDYQAAGINEQVTKSSMKQHFIYLCEIDRVYQITNYLVIIKKNQEIEKFIFKNEDKMKEVLNMLKKNYRDHFKTALFYMCLQAFEQDKIYDEIEFLKKNGKTSYSQDVQAYTWDGLVSNLQIELDDNFIYEVEKVEKRVRKRCLLKDLEIIRVIDKSPNYNLVLLFKKDIEMVLKVPSTQEREKLLSAILTLRSFVVPQTGQIDSLTVLVNQTIDFAQKILGHDPLEAAQYTQEYESMLLRKLAENIHYKESMKINSIIDEIILNTAYGQLLKTDQRQIKTIIKEIQNCLEDYLNFEINEQQTVDLVLNRYKYNTQINYFGAKQYTRKGGEVFELKVPEEPILQDLNNQETLNNDTISNNNQQLLGDDGNDKVKIFNEIQDKIAKYLSILHIFLNSKVIMTEIQEHEDVILLLIKILASKSSYIGFLASQVLKNIGQHYSGTESKLEQMNKKIMIRGKQQGQQQSSSNLQTDQHDHNFDLGENQYLFHATFDYLQYYDQLHESKNIVGSLHLFNISNILKSILQTRRISTCKEELQIFAQMFIEEDQRKLLSDEDLKQLQQLQERFSNKIQLDDPLRNKPYFHLADKFSLFGLISLTSNEYFDIQYMFTFILNEGLSYFKKYEADRLAEFQQYILTYSIQFIWHLFLQMESPLKEQKKLSINLLAKMLYQNVECIQLLLRCYPKTLIEKVETPVELYTSLSWQEQEWEEFFTVVTYKKYDTATMQWNDETRKELKEKLSHELHEFIEAKKIHKQVLQDGSKKELILPNHEFNRNKQVISRCRNLKWNYMEFIVKYNCLNHKYLVWKYYLTTLLDEKNLSERQRPKFTEIISKPVVFWNELKIKFMSSFDPDEQKIILKTMCVLYNNHHLQLKDLKTIPYLVKLLDQDQFDHCHFILLQLIHVSLSVQEEIASKNMKKFIKSDGLQVLLNCMKLVFKDLLREDRDKQLQLEQNPQLMVLSSLSREQYEKVVHGPIAMHDQANYTNSDTNSRYFKRNSECVCMGILSLKILDLIFKEMSSIDYVPLPTNREFLMKSDSIATIAQMLMIENVDLTRELTIFNQLHMNNHYSYFKLKYSGMIEFLVLSMSTRNGDRALEILEKFQEVCLDYNLKLKFGLFNSNDLKMIQEDKFRNEARLGQLEYQYNDLDHELQKEFQEDLSRQKKEVQERIQDLKRLTILSESILLRFLPIPFIKYLYEKGKQSFLSIYKMQNYESPILIWNSDLRLMLENNIKEHAGQFINELKEYAALPSQKMKSTDNFPDYSVKYKQFRKIVKYPTIENEVRCGRYYLRVWVNQKKDSKNFFRIPYDEEEEFYKNLQIELRLWIYEEQFKDQQKIIILFKSCLLALNTFENKRIMSLNEVKKILVDTCKQQQNDYNETTKQIIYIGIKIIHQAIKLNTDDLKIILSKNGAEIIGEIFSLILRHSFNSKHLSTSFAKNSFYDESMETSFKEEHEGGQGRNLDISNSPPEQSSKITIDITEAKILSLCVQSFNIILNFDIQAFVDYPLEQRTNIFRQISRILDLSFCLMPIFKDRVLNQKNFLGDSKIQQNSYFGLQNNSLRSRSRGRKDKNKKQRKNKRNSPQKPKLSLAQNNSSQNIISGVLSNRYQEKMTTPAFKKQHSEGESRKKHFKKDPNIDYKDKILLKLINKHKDKYSISLILDISRQIFELTKEITKYPVLHPELIASGMAWKTLFHIYFYLKEEVRKFKDLEFSLKYATVTLKNLFSFDQEFAEKGAESFAFKNLQKTKENDIMMEFSKCITSIFGNKILETLIQQVNIANNVLVFDNYEPKQFLRLFSIKEQKTPELVWNDETREELAKALQAQIRNLPYSFSDVLKNFEYSVNQRELRVQNIFVRHFNIDNEDFYPQDLNKFADALIEKLKETLDNHYLVELSPQDCQNCLELVRAFYKLLIKEQMEIKESNVFNDYISTLCNMIKVKPSSEDQQLSPLESARLKEMSNQVFEIILHITKMGGFDRGDHFSKLKSNIDFIKLLIRSLYCKEKEVIEMDKVIIILQNTLKKFTQPQDIENFLINTGLIMFILNMIFDKTLQKNQKKMTWRAELTRLILQTSKETEEISDIYQKYIPKYFFCEIQHKYNYDPEVEKIVDFLKDFDSSVFENVFIIWNTGLRNESHQRIIDNCEKILQHLEHSQFDFYLDDSEIVNPNLENEIIVQDVILRIYNKNPAVFINTRLNSFILQVSIRLQSVAQELFKLGQIEGYKFEEGFEPSTPQQAFNQKKFKYLCHQSLVMLTSILLSIEQLLNNEYNPNRVMAYKKEEKAVESKFLKTIIEKSTEPTYLDNKLYPILGFWLQTQVFLSKHIPIEIKLTFLQIVYLIIEVSDALKILKENLSLMQFITDSIEKIHNDDQTDTLEDVLILFITFRMLRRDPRELIPELLTTSMSKLVKIFEKKKKLRKLVEFIFQNMTLESHYKGSVIEQLKSSQLNTKIDLKAIVEGYNANSDYAQAITNIWRPKPTSASDAKRIYDISEGYYIEDKVTETNLQKMKLPLLSQKSVITMVRNDSEFEEEKQFNQSQGANPMSQVDQFMMSHMPKSGGMQQLDFQPLFNYEEDIGVEPIERRSDVSEDDMDY